MLNFLIVMLFFFNYYRTELVKKCHIKKICNKVRFRKEDAAILAYPAASLIEDPFVHFFDTAGNATIIYTLVSQSSRYFSMFVVLVIGVNCLWTCGSQKRVAVFTKTYTLKRTRKKIHIFATTPSYY
jgi:hypothetical protein